jgi:DNA-binding SARP family transcriptional activator
MTGTGSKEIEVSADPVEIDVRLLGGPVAVYLAGQRVALGPLEQLLAALLFAAAGTFVSADRLIERIWDEPSGRSRARLHEVVRDLRRSLAAVHPAAAALVVQRDGSYAAMVDAGRVDLHRFRARLRQAQEPARRGDYEQAADRYLAAFDEWDGGDLVQPGEPLGGLRNRWADGVRSGLESEHSVALLGMLGADVRLGRYDSAIPMLRRLTEAEPRNEAAAEMYMSALCKVERQRDAVVAYLRLRERLTEEGLEPSPRIQRLYQRILRQDPSLGAPAGQPRQETPPAAGDAETDAGGEPAAGMDSAARRRARRMVGRNVTKVRKAVGGSGPMALGSGAMAADEITNNY